MNTDVPVYEFESKDAMEEMIVKLEWDMCMAKREDSVFHLKYQYLELESASWKIIELSWRWYIVLG